MEVMFARLTVSSDPQSAKRLGSIVSRFGESLTRRSFGHALNAPSPTETTLSGSRTDLSSAHSANASAPIVVRLFENVISISPEHLANARSPTVSTVFAI